MPPVAVAVAVGVPPPVAVAVGVAAPVAVAVAVGVGVFFFTGDDQLELPQALMPNSNRTCKSATATNPILEDRVIAGNSFVADFDRD